MTSLAIIGGTGALGAALARRLAAAGREVWIGSRDPAKAQAAAEAIAAEFPGARVGGLGLAQAAERGDICVVTVPYAAHADTLAQIRAGVQGKILIDATVPLRPPAVGKVQLPAVGCAVLEGAAVLGEGVRIVSALQNIGAEKLGSGGAIDGDVLVAGDDAAAVETVRGLLGELGLRSWHVGPLANSAAAEALTSVLIQLNRRYKLGQAGVRITGQPKGEGVGKAAAVSITGVPGLPLFVAGDDLAAAICEGIVSAGLTIEDGDVLVVAQKVVSKTEGRQVALSSVRPGENAKAAAAASHKDPAVLELIERESTQLMRVAPGVVVARHGSGQVLANAGIDASNISHEGGDHVLLWPADADDSARRLRGALEARFGVKLAVIISDSMGRAWRMGTSGTAIGVSGLRPVRDRRGEADLYGRTLNATQVAVADELAAAASLVIGEAAEGLPVAIVRGAVYDRDETAGVGDLVRPIEMDLFP